MHVTEYQAGVEGDRNACSASIHATAKSEITSRESNLAYTQVTTHFSVSDSDDSTDHNSRSCCISGPC